jgi:hypothetical protein
VRAFRTLAEGLCGIRLSEVGDDEEVFWQEAARHPDVFIADRQRNILRLEEIAPVRNLSLFPPTSGFRRIFFIDRAERLNQNAANALLKILEEPHSSLLFVLTAKRTQAMLPTIASRCLKLPISLPDKETTSIENTFEKDDLNFFSSLFEKVAPTGAAFPSSLWEPFPLGADPSTLAHLLDKAEDLAKRYTAHILQDIIISFLSKTIRANATVLPHARFIQAEVLRWKDCEGLNPSPALWLLRIFLRISCSKGS